MIARGTVAGAGRLRALALAPAWIAVLAATVLLAACGAGSGSSPGPASSIDGEALARDFVAILTDPELQAGVVQQATATTARDGEVLELRVTMAGDVALPDVALRLVVETEGESTGFGLVVLGDRVYLDVGEGWQEAQPGDVDTGDLAAALVVVDDPADLAYAGTEVVDGETLYRLVAVGPLPYAPGALSGTGAGTATDTGVIEDLTAYVRADGTPVSIEFSFTASGTDAAGETTVRGTSEIRFSDVGVDPEIAPPPLAPTPAP